MAGASNGPRRVPLAVAVWIVAGVATLAGAAWLLTRTTGGLGRVAALTAEVEPARWAVIVPLTALFYLLDWLRYYALLRLLGLRLPVRLGLELCAVSYFCTTLTPVAELHVPAMVLWLTRRGYPAAAATAATIAKSVYMVLWIGVLALVGARLDPAASLPPAIADHLLLWIAPAAGLVALLALIMFAPGGLHRFCARRLAVPGLPRWRRALWSGFDETARALATIGAARHPMHLVAHVACIAFVLTYVAIGHQVAHGVGLDVDPGRAFTAFGGGLLVAYLAPVPGSIGVAEGATAYLLDPSLPPAAVTTAILQRLCCWYLVVVPGFVLVVREARRAGWAALVRGLRAPGAPAAPPAGEGE